MIEHNDPAYIYTYAYSKEERSLCHMEMRSFFGKATDDNIIKSTENIDPSRSPFIRERIEVVYEGETLQDILDQVTEIKMGDQTFKVIFSKINDLKTPHTIEYQERREIERAVGWIVEGEADVHHPDHIFGMAIVGNRWYFGHYRKSEAVWLQHTKKPREYSTALSTRVARAVANIAVPDPHGVKSIDPCCGIGTVLVEALSMGINMEGRDINPLVVQGSRENIEHFHLQGTVEVGPISEVMDSYDVAVIDMPYNLYTHATPEDQLAILKHARRFAKKVVVITIETMDNMVKEAGFRITDRCETQKGYFTREILVCE
ncbi:RNA methyltransferase [Sutcliffiella horikoshii]|uniref:TRM11 family SAM-dependent methyltransferase n=1 Tax=Sutcliffiella horikoshii TaxID=79883 RepID=UPI0007D0A43D|nr:RNA methyltransferase [Sutcliffiella horikoshii]MCM3619065.1 RNA methyltransferase [Sutcliffiella horikoshii]